MAPIGWHVELRLRPGSRQAFAALTAEMVAWARAEPGCVLYERFTDGDVVDLFEMYQSEGAATAHLERFLAQFGSRLNEMAERRHFHVYGEASPGFLRLVEPLGARQFGAVVATSTIRQVRVRGIDIVTVANGLADSLTPVGDTARYAATVNGTEWTARRTLDHIADALVLYSRYVGTRATGRLEALRDGRASATIESLLRDVVDAAAVLKALVDQLSCGETVFHPAGHADDSGWSAMACDEILVHGLEIAATVGATFQPDPDLVQRVVARLFPWTPDVGSPLDKLLWANGRLELPGHPRLDSFWYWWCRPLSEWDGRRHTRTAPPAW